MDELLRRAVEYPFDIPTTSFIFNPTSGEFTPWDDSDAIDLSSRVPVLAVGSNASPTQLRAKFPALGEFTDPIPAMRVQAHGVDVVYAARISRYGAVPATPFLIEGVVARLHVTLLTEAELEHMNRTESLGVGYDLIELPSVRVEPWLSGQKTLLSYVARAGALAVEGEPVALDAVSTTGRTFVAWSEIAMLNHVASLVGAASIGALVNDVVNKEGYQTEVNEKLWQWGIT